MIDLLANPIWHSLSTCHAHLAQGNELAKRYPEEIGPLSGIAQQSRESWEALRTLMSPGQACVVFLDEAPKPGSGLKVTKHFALEQMVCETPAWKLDASMNVGELGARDVAEMVALAALTEPGPFRHRTIELGGYRGIRDENRLVAMAGWRTAVPGYREVSAVCTHPDYRGRGFAAALVSAVGEGIGALGERPYLHVRQDNVAAIKVYRRLGYESSRTFHGIVVTLAS